MHLALIDWLVIAGYFAINMGIGLWYRRRATDSTEELLRLWRPPENPT